MHQQSELPIAVNAILRLTVKDRCSLASTCVAKSLHQVAAGDFSLKFCIDCLLLEAQESALLGFAECTGASHLNDELVSSSDVFVFVGSEPELTDIFCAAVDGVDDGVALVKVNRAAARSRGSGQFE